MLDFIFATMLLACIAFYVLSTVQVIVETWKDERYFSIFGIASLTIVISAIIYLGITVLPF